MARVTSRSTVALCVSVFIICVIMQGVQSRRARVSSAKLVGTVSVISIGGKKKENNRIVEMRCPNIVDPTDGIAMPDPNCTFSVIRLAKGAENVAAFQEEYDVMTGDTIEATFDIRNRTASANGRPVLDGQEDDSDDPTYKLRPGSIRVLDRANRQKEIYNGTTIDITAVVYLAEFCGFKNPFQSHQEVRRYLFENEPGGSVGGNMQTYYKTCSYGKVTWEPKNVVVVGPFQFPCQATVSGRTKDLSRECDTFFYSVLANDYAKQIAANDPKLRAILQSGTSTKQLREVVILPAAANCGFAGAADAACHLGATFCRSWIQGKIATNVYGIFHELQHNTGLMHAATWDLEYGDKSDPMGDIYVSTTNEPQCHNPVSNWKINWATPVPGGYLTHTSFTPRTNRLTFTIPASSVSDKNMVIVDLGIVPTDVKYTTSRPRFVKYFLAYRVRNTTAGGYDSGLISFFNQKVTIHRSDISTAANDNLLSTIYLSAGPRFSTATGGDPTFSDGTVWKSPFAPVNAVTGTGGGIRVKVVSRDLKQAVVEVCRMYSETEGTPGSAECRSNMDRDCDGLISSVDPDCTGK